MGNIIYRAGGYLRLSDKDLRLGAHEQSESIENQRNIILDYVSKHPEIELVDFFIDDGYTGLNYNREGFQTLMSYVDRGEINMIITKELSRLGREHADTIQLFKKDFVIKKIRYVAVLDNIDFNGRIEGLEIPFKVMVNDYYSQALSKTITETLRNMQKQGKYVAAFCPYGYKKDPDDKHKLIIDEEAARVVRKIYQYYLQGNSIDWICRVLTEEQVLTPEQYKGLHSGFKACKTLESTKYWTYTSVWRILKSPVYYGTMVQHTREMIAYNLPGTRRVPDKEVIKVEGTHEGIVSYDDWEKVQQLISAKVRNWKQGESENIFAGLILCGECGRSLGRVRDHHYKRHYYRCNTYARMGKKYCTSHKIYESVLKDIVMQAIRKNVMEAEEFQAANINMAVMQGRIHNQNASLMKKYRQRLDKLEDERSNMLKKLARDILTEQDFLLYKGEYETEKKQIENQILSLKKELENDNIINRKLERWLEEFFEHKNVRELTRDIVLHLIKNIRIYNGNRVEIEFRFQNPFRESKS